MIGAIRSVSEGVARSVVASARKAWQAGLVAKARDMTLASAQRSCLVLAPHPDDETLGCGATIMRKRELRTPVKVVIATDGSRANRQSAISRQELVSLRRAEAVQAARALGVARSDLIFLDFPDGQLGEHREALARRLVEIVRAFKPQEILSPFVDDPHVDHRTLAETVRRLVTEGHLDCPVLEYPTWSWRVWPWSTSLRAGPKTLRRLLWEPIVALVRARPLLVRTNGYVERKQQAVSIYRSQTANITGEATWKTLGNDLLAHFFRPYELYLPVNKQGELCAPLDNTKHNEEPGPWRILHVFPGLAFGGGQTALLSHLSNCDPKRFGHRVCYLLASHDLAPQFHQAGIPTICLDHQGRRSSVRTLLRVVQLIRTEGIDVVHTNTRLDRLYGQLAALICRVPVVDTVHGRHTAGHYGLDKGRPRPDQHPLRWARLVAHRWLERRVVGHVIAVSEELRTEWLSHPSARRIAGGQVSVVYPSLSFDTFLAQTNREDELDGQAGGDRIEQLRRQMGIAGRAPVLLNVARLKELKGQRLLVPMMATVLRRWPEAVLLIVGEGDARKDIEGHIAAAGLDDAVHLLGRRDNVADLLALCDVFVFPSLSEGFGIAVLEAMAACRPVVASSLPVLGEMIEDGVTGRLVEPGDHQAMAEAVLALLDDPAGARALAEQAHQVAKKRFSATASAQTLEAIYFTLLRERRR